ncbi:MAG: hypothetical protein J5950_00160 [Clostridia bacterium]|nr:hypothetical protein [Clostridia bacterium]
MTTILDKLSKRTIGLLEDIESRIDPEAEEDYIDQWSDFLNDRFTGDIFTPRRKKLSLSNAERKGIMINDAMEDFDSMLYSQLLGVSFALDDSESNRYRSWNLAIRANYGSCIGTSLFGAEVFIMPYKTNTLPITRTLTGDDAMERVLDKGIPDNHAGLGAKAFGFGEFVQEVFSHYPKISKYVTVYHPDIQGPIDNCELLFGEEMFYKMMDEPDTVHDVLDLITRSYISFMEEWQKLYPPRPDMNLHWGHVWHKGTILLRCDSAMNLSPDMYDEFCVPYDRRLLDRFGGGGMHFCGKGDHYIKSLCEAPGLSVVNMTQPHLNDMEVIYRNTVDKGIKLVGFDHGRAQRDVGRGFNHSVCT